MKGIIIVFSLIFLTSCPNELLPTTTCNVDFPLQDLIWLREIKNNFELSSSSQKRKIIQYNYNSETVFMIDSCVGCSDNLTKVYDCNGNIICEFGGIAGVNTCPDFEKNAIIDLVLWEN